MNNNCINGKTNETLKGFDLLRKLSTLLPRQNLLTIYKFVIKPHLDYGNVMYNQPLNEALSNRIKSVQFKVGLATTGSTKQESSREIL